MIYFEQYHEVKRLRRELNLSARQIAKQMGLNRTTVAKWLAKERYEPRARPEPRVSKLDPHKDLIIALLEKHPFTGAQIYQRLRSEHNYTGGKSILNDFIASVRPLRHKAFLHLDFEPGDCVQVDWGTHTALRIGGTLRKLHYFAAVLCHSRQLYVEFFLSQGMDCFLTAHRNALEYFGGVPRRTMHDNLKSAVLERLPGLPPKFNPRYLDFAAHYGFKPVACNVRAGNEKGRVENSIGYIQKNFLNGLQISSLVALNAEARAWMETTANVREHRTTGRRPIDMFTLEQQQLQTLPMRRADISMSRRVRASNRCRVSFESNRYSVPFEHAGQLLELRAHPDAVFLYRGEKIIAQHVRNYDRGQDIENPDHLGQLLKERKRGENAALLARFLAVSPQSENYYNGLRQRDLHAMGHVRRILLLVRIHGREAVRAALEEAVELRAYGSDYLHNILDHRRALLPMIGQLHLTRGEEHLNLEVPPPDCSNYDSEPY